MCKDCLKALAGETLALAFVLVMLVTDPAVCTAWRELGLERDVTRLHLLAGIHEILSCGGELMGRLDLLEALLARHHDLFCELYGDRLKPKIHYLMHLVLQIKKFSVFLTRFAGGANTESPKGVQPSCTKRSV